MKTLNVKSTLVLIVLLLQTLGLSFSAQTKNKKVQNIEKSTKVNFRKDVPFTQRLSNGGINLKGDITIISNSIVSIEQDGIDANDNYNGFASNGLVFMDYIDVDSDPTTFSSSKSSLNLPSCSKVVHAGLYWAAVYPRTHWDTSVNSAPRKTDFNQIKFKLPGGNYLDITGEVIYDDGEDTSKPYTCYKDVTNLVAGLKSPNGDYFAANIRSIVGRDAGGLGSSGGWVLVVVYENDLEPSRRVSIFDGFSSVGSGSTQDISYSGFKTIPTGPVKAKMLVAALEGDKAIDGDRFKIKDVYGNYQDLSTTNLNPKNNFFNGSITINDTYLAGRFPASENTLGFDADLFTINNVNNKLISNGQTKADIKLTSSGDVYWVFLNAMSVDIIEPNIELIKTIDDGKGNDIAGNDVDLGDVIWYNVSFRNKGNDDALNTILVDKLPKNVDFIKNDIVVPNGVTYTYDPPIKSNGFRGILKFNIPNRLVKNGGTAYNIRIKVKVVDNCNDLRDVCSNKIDNQIFTSYKGKTSGIEINDDPSFYGVNACNIGLEGPSNFLVDVSGCKYERNEILCATSVVLTAGNGFLSYKWKDENGKIIGTKQSVTVSKTGKYTVDKIAPVGCISTSEIVNVVSFTTQKNPLLLYADEIKTCPNDGSKLSEIYLCGDQSVKEIKTSIVNSNTILWQKLDETSCKAVTNSSCANVDNSCTWNTVKTDNDYTAKTPGKYRLEIRSQGGCFKRFYFNVFKATINPVVVKKDIICGTAGSITVNKVPVDYEYSLTNTTNSYQTSNVFPINKAGRYNLYIRKKGGSASSCIYTVTNIDIAKKDIEVKLVPTAFTCSNSKGKIRVQVDNIPGKYTYKLYKDGNLTASAGPINNNDYSFEVTKGGTYSVEVTAPNTCSFKGNVTLTKPNPLTISATTTKNINCLDGSIKLNASGGVPKYNFAIWSYNGNNLYTSVDAIPITDFFTTKTVDITSGKEGDYKFLVIDSNNCWSISNSVKIQKEKELVFNETIKNSTCNGEDNGSIHLTVSGSDLGYSLEYSIDGGTTYQTKGYFNKLSPGNYTIKINAKKAGETCTYEKTATITEPAVIIGTASLTQNLTCTTDGNITFTSPSGGKAPYKFSLDNSNYVSNKIFKNLKAGTFLPSIKDANNCVLTLPNIVINSLPTEPTLTASVSYSCDGKGTITVTPTNANYSYSFNNGTFGTNNVFSNISAGSHSVKVNYGSNCTKTILIDVLANKAFKGSITNVKDVVCNGNSNGGFVINAENFEGSFQYSLNGGSWKTTTTSPVVLNTLSKGSYTVQLKKGSCTLDLGTQTISEPTEVIVTASITKDLSCSNTHATITPKASGGTAPYEFSIDNGITWKSKFTNLSAGNYTIKAKDKNGCLAKTDAVIKIDNPVVLKHTATSTQCYTGNNGEITVTVTQGNGNYLFKINNGPWLTPDSATPNSYTFKNLVPKKYTVNVKDALGCESTATTHTISPQLNVNVVAKDISCTIGSITAKATGGKGSYTYAFVTTGNTPTTTNFINSNIKNISTAGDYDVYVRDNSGNIGFCEFVKTVTIRKTPDLAVTATTTNPKCFGDKGKIKVDISGSVAPYTIEVTEPAGYTNIISSFIGNSNEYANLSKGNYTIKVTGKDGCTKTATTVITEPLELKATISPIVPPCNASNVPADFGFKFNVTNSFGSSIIQYSADNGTTWSTNNTFMGLVSGTKVYPIIRLLEADGVTVRCSKILEAYTIPYPVSNLLVSTAAGGSCADGFSVTVEAKDGVGPYQFAINSTTAWQTPTPSNSSDYIFDKLVPGLSYTFYVKDATGCIKQNKVDVYDTYKPDILITGNVTKNACATSNTGEIEFSIDDSKNPLSGTINWKLFEKANSSAIKSGSQSNTNTIKVGNLAAGDYYITITNSASCSWGSLDVTIKKGAPITGLVVKNRDITCALPGIVEISSISGGFGDYTYTLTSTNFVNPITSKDKSIEVPLSNLVDATISSTILVSVKDASGCGTNLNSVTLKVSEKPEISKINTNNCDANKTITITGAKGLPPYFYSIDDGVNYVSTSKFENLSVGDYLVKIKDSNGCESPSKKVAIIPTLNFEALITKNLDCSLNPNATLTLNVISGSGDYDYDVYDSAGTEIFAKAKLASNPTTLSLGKGIYNVKVYDNLAGCFKTIEVEIKESTKPEFTYTTNNSLCEGSNSGSILLKNLKANLTYSYSINPVSGTFDANTNSFIDVSPGTYTITALGSNGCSFVKSAIKINENNAIVVPTPIVEEFSCTTANINKNARIIVDKTAIIGGSGIYTIFEFVDTKKTATTVDDVILQRGTSATFVSNNKNGGNYSINIYDSLGCIGTTNATILPFSEISSVKVTVDKALDCFTGEDISVSYTSTFPITNVRYSIVGEKGFSATNNTGKFTNLAADNYTISVKDITSGCSTDISHQVLNSKPFALTIKKQEDVTCFGSSTGKIMLDFSVATPYTNSYNYVLYDNATRTATSISGVGTRATTISNLPVGEYYAVVTMPNSPFCTITSEVFSIYNPLQPLDFTTTKTPANCAVLNSGKIFISATGGWEEYQYKVTTLSGTIIQDFNTNNSFENLKSGTYVVAVKDKNNCEVVKNVVLEAPKPIQATLVETTSNLCLGDSNAAVRVDVTSGGQGSPPNYWYQIQLDGQAISAKQKSNVFKNLAAGKYIVTISDDYSCDLELPITINEPTKVEVQATITSTVSCFNGNASITLTASGGAGNYTFSSDGINFSNSSIFNVAPGKHQFYAKDVNGCISNASETIEILPITPLTATLHLDVALVNCAAENTAVLSANVSGGLGNNLYELLDSSNTVLRPQQTSETFANLGAGTYKIRVTSGDCQTTTALHTIADPVPLELNTPIKVTNISCFGSNDGSITIDAKGGTGNLIYSINQLKFETKNTFTGLSSGNYDVIVQDESGCFILQRVTISEPSQLTASVTNIKEETCFKNGDASFSIKISGGTAPYKTKLDNGVFVDNQLYYNNLTGGKTYVVSIEDSMGCETVVSVPLKEAVNLNLQTALNVNCSNYLTTITASVNPSFVNEIKFSLDGGTPQVSGIFKNIDSGTHTLTVSHKSGCVLTKDIVINNPEPLVFNTPVSTKDISCFGENNGVITIDAKGGKGDLWCSIDGVNFKKQSVFGKLPSGTYEVTVKDELACKPIKQTVTIKEPKELKVKPVNIKEETCLGTGNASFELDISGDQAPYKTKLNNGAFVVGRTIFSNLEGGKSYTVVVKGQNGCEKVIDVSLEPAVKLNLFANVTYSCDKGAVISGRINSEYQDKITYSLDGTNYTTDGKYTNLSPGKYMLEALHVNGCSVTKEVEVENIDPIELVLDTSTKNKIIANPLGGSPPYTYSLNGGDFNWDNNFLITATKTYTITVKDAIGCEVSATVEGEYIDITIPNFFTPNNNNENDYWYPKKIEEYHEIEVSVFDRYSRLLKEFKGIQKGWDGFYNGKPMPSGDYWYVIYYKDILGEKKKLMGNFTLYR
ncbi:T9SS type B sorting domain-containing protein [Polaribacter cellanae]|uniref:T9SS type B sorting domain-containing protein n=1 Tax=Polaribacter cellanae TaxID=2818493 RepID=A0A975CPJ0_9FLAO|nr:T9SS type B sorting domain-containing protein [Polaribacter cellanae]QTE21492.1 T9SS type B sorting domain-containing protein [Polaribacter cellanae]